MAEKLHFPIRNTHSGSPNPSEPTSALGCFGPFAPDPSAAIHPPSLKLCKRSAAAPCRALLLLGKVAGDQVPMDEVYDFLEARDMIEERAKRKLICECELLKD
jgi:hypothetical protein